MSQTIIPPIDLRRARAAIEDELRSRFDAVLESSAFVGGPEVKAFEAGFTEFLGAAGCVGVGNGTDALIIGLRALGLQPGDEVIVPAFSFFASAEAVVWAGGRPVFADVDPETLNLDVADAARRVTDRTVGILPVALYGRAYDVDGVLALAEQRNLWVFEDAAQAHGARRRGQRIGTFGQLAAWSFYPTKNLGCFGDGGAVTGSDPELLERVRLLANHGQTGRYHHVTVGTNSRLDSLQAAVLNARLPRLDEDNASRRAHAARYRGRLEGVGDLRFLRDDPDDEPVYHQLSVLTERRDALMDFLGEAGIRAMVHYPSPLHRQPALAEPGVEAPSLPVAERAAETVLCLPVFPELEPAEVDRVCEAVETFFAPAG